MSYQNNEIGYEIGKYNSLLLQTGKRYKSLVKLHKDCVKAVDKHQEESTGIMPAPIMAVDARLMAWLTDLALRDLAVGAYLTGHYED